MATLLALLLVLGQVDLPLAPQSQFAPAGTIVTVDLRAEAGSAASVAAIDAILSWNPAELQFIGPLPGSFTWFISGFLPDPDGINADVTDGSALYTALAPLATPLVLPPDIVVASFQFKILTGGHVTLLPSLGTFGKTRVVSTTPGVEITGAISGPVCIGIPGTWTDLGYGGIAGVTGVPVLTGSGPQACEANTIISLTNAKPNQVAFLPVGIGTLNLFQGLADYRRYFLPARPVTLAFRLLHFGRYGSDSEDPRLSPLFLGWDGLVRGYSLGSFSAEECPVGDGTPGSCPVFDQLVGSRILVGNAELRFPLFGLLNPGGGYYGGIPLELAFFGDAGVAWDSNVDPTFLGGERRIVKSAGIAARFNAFGFAVLQVDFSRPFDRPGRGWVWQFSLQPGF